MLVFGKRVRFLALIFGAYCLPGPLVFADEMEADLTEAIRENVGSLRFASYGLDMGSIKQGDKLEFHFPFVEEKGAAVRILGVHQECGCLSQSLEAGQDIAAGTSSELLIKVDSTHFIGNFDKEVVILTNEDRDKPHVFRMRAHIERQVKVEPPFVELNLDAKASEQPRARVTVRSTSKQTLHIEKVEYNEDTLEVQVNQVNQTWELLVRWKGPEGASSINETIDLLIDGSVKKVKIPVVGLQKRPSRLSLSAPHP